MWPNPQFPEDLVTFTEEILNGKFHFLRCASSEWRSILEYDLLVLSCALQCVKKAQIRSFFWSVFSLIRTEYGKILCIQCECGKIRTRKNSVFGHFSRSVLRCYISSDCYSSLQKYVWITIVIVTRFHLGRFESDFTTYTKVPMLYTVQFFLTNLYDRSFVLSSKFIIFWYSILSLENIYNNNLSLWIICCRLCGGI